jgi:putative ABC transport system permease protein
LLILLAAVGFVLLICCVNAANLLIGRSAARQGEMAIRAALGSGRGRLVRQLLAENLILSFLAGIVGTGFAAAAVYYLRAARPIEMPPGSSVQLNAPVLVFTFVVSVGVALLFGLLPAWRGSRMDLNEALKAGGRASIQGQSQHRTGKFLIAAEVMLTVILLSAAGLLIETVERFASAPLGLRPEGLTTAFLRLPVKSYADTDRREQFYERVTEELKSIPGLRGVALSNVRPLNGGGAMDVMEVEGHPEPRVEDLYDTFQLSVSPDYFRVLEVPLDRGRGFQGGDQKSTEPVAIVNEALVRKYLRDEEPLGRRIRPYRRGERNNPWLTIVGVVGNEKRTTVYQEMAWVDAPLLYRPLAQNPPGSAYAFIRAATEANAFGQTVPRTVANIDPDVPVEDIQAMSAIESKILAYPRFRAMLLGGFAAMALILAGVGVFGVLSHAVSQRTHEIGLRMALGATQGVVLRLILKEGALLMAGGAVLGIAGTWAEGHYLATLLYGVQASDPRVVAATLLVLFPAAFAAMWLPARRASRVDPMRALKDE